MAAEYRYDAFICHASEDKEVFVRELAESLRAKGFRIWYDEFILAVGDSLVEKINDGLKQSKYGIVIFSKAFFNKNWTLKELSGLVALEEKTHKKILPILLDIQHNYIKQNFPILADLVCIDATKGMDSVVDALSKVMQSIVPKLVIYPTVIFDERISEAFPGIRNLYETSNTQEIIDRLSIVLKDPLRLHGYYPPFMLFTNRPGTLDISRFKVLSGNKVLIVHHEMVPKTMAVYRPTSYWQQFIYLETKADSRTGLYPDSKEHEEFAIWKDEIITRDEYDDGYIFRDGKSIQHVGAELRIRNLIPSNYIITSRASPININAFDRERSSIMKDILKGDNSLSDFINAFRILPRHPNDS